MPRGGAREGAGRPITIKPELTLEPLTAADIALRAYMVPAGATPDELYAQGKAALEPSAEPKIEVVEATLQTATLLEVAIGQSSVKLELDSKGQVKPTVHVYHRSPTKAAATAEAEMDRLLLKYAADTAPKAAS